MFEDPTNSTTVAMATLYEAMVPQIQHLVADITPRAQKYPDGLASAATVAGVNLVLKLVRRVVSRLPEAGMVVLLPEDGSVTHPDLLVTLSLAQTALLLFRRKSGLIDIDGSWVWLTVDA